MFDAAVLIIFPGLMAYAAASDLLMMTIPNKISLALVLAFAMIVAAGYVPWDAALMHAAAGSLVLLVCFGLFSFGWIGGGDAKLAAAVALWLGFQALLEYFLVASIIGGLLSLALLQLRAFPLPAFALQWGWLARLHDRRSGVPYGIALAVAALLVYPHSRVWFALVGA